MLSWKITLINCMKIIKFLIFFRSWGQIQNAVHSRTHKENLWGRRKETRGPTVVAENLKLRHKDTLDRFTTKNIKAKVILSCATRINLHPFRIHKASFTSHSIISFDSHRIRSYSSRSWHRNGKHPFLENRSLSKSSSSDTKVCLNQINLT